MSSQVRNKLDGKQPATIKEYIEEAQPEARPHLREIYQILKGVAPAGTEAIRWGVPVFWDRSMLFGFAAYEVHLSFGPGKAAIKHFSRELEEHRTGTDTMQIPYDRPFPTDLVRRIATFCLSDVPLNNS